ncbi:hypothetical protein [Enterococcus sp. AD013-P3]|uniref:hypothetical protein n=1 Tax=Enterococcus sp. AD013-P3 TaxID=3411036 RepID=UPI003B935EB6
MKRILLITKDCVQEKKRQAELQSRGYEVFCSERVLKQILEGKELPGFFDFFQIILLSEQLADREAQEVTWAVRKGTSAQTLVYRFVHELPMQDTWTQQITAYLEADSDLALQQLPPAHLQTGAIACFSKKSPTDIASTAVAFYDVHWFFKRLEESLSTEELLLLEQIFATKGKLLPFEEVSVTFSNNKRNSELQGDIRSLIFNLRKKITVAGYQGSSILLEGSACYLSPAFSQWFAAAKQAL